MVRLFFALSACFLLASCAETPRLSAHQQTADFNAPAIAGEKPDKDITDKAAQIAVEHQRDIFTVYKIRSNFKNPDQPDSRLDRWRVLMP